MINLQIKELKEKYEGLMTVYSQQVRDYVDTYGNDKSDFLVHRREISNYYRGAYNALLELERSL